MEPAQNDTVPGTLPDQPLEEEMYSSWALLILMTLLIGALWTSYYLHSRPAVISVVTVQNEKIMNREGGGQVRVMISGVQVTVDRNIGYGHCTPTTMVVYPHGSYDGDGPITKRTAHATEVTMVYGPVYVVVENLDGSYRSKLPKPHQPVQMDHAPYAVTSSTCSHADSVLHAMSTF
ncbi:hypothetical protein K501DRAFT_280618 [Backusella circina FSU 941]|nr:hypothetical protein K501DRAFT_280618 [Backusella circina FSU 941]